MPRHTAEDKATQPGALPGSIAFQRSIAMDTTTRSALCLFTILFIIVSNVSALTLDIVDKSYLLKNEYTISDQNGAQVTAFTGDNTVTVSQGKSYFIDYQPMGIFDFGKDISGDPFYLKTLTDFLNQKNMLSGIIALCGVVLLIGMWKP